MFSTEHGTKNRLSNIRRRISPRPSRLNVEPLEDRTVLSCFSSLAAGLDKVLMNVASTVNGVVDGVDNLPFLTNINTNAQNKIHVNVQSFISSFESPLKQALAALPDGSSVQDVQHALFTVLGPKEASNPNGLGILGDTDGSGTIDTEDIQVKLSGSDPSNCSIDINARLVNPLTDIDTSTFQFGLGLPAVPFADAKAGGVHLQVAIAYELTAHYDSKNGFSYNPQQLTLSAPGLPFPELDNHELGVLVHATLQKPGDPGAPYQDDQVFVGLFQATATDNQQNPSLMNADIFLDNLSDNAPPTVNVVGSAAVNMNLLIDPNNNDGFPSLTSNLELGWSFDTINPQNATRPTVSFNDVTVNLSQLMSKVLGQFIPDMQLYQKPLEPLIIALRTEIPVLTDLTKALNLGPATIENLFKLAGNNGAAGSFDTAITISTTLLDLANDINAINASNLNDLTINLGNFVLGGANEDLTQEPASKDPSSWYQGGGSLSTDLTGWEPDALQLSDVAGVEKGINQQLAAANVSPELVKAIDNFFPDNLNNLALNFPIFDDPAKGVFQLLMGKDAQLISLNATLNDTEQMPQQLESLELPIPGLHADFNSNLHVDLLFNAAYDTYGIREFLHDHKSADFLDGFYLGTDDVNPDHKDGTHLHITGALTAQIGADFLVFQVGGGGSIGGTLNVDLSDPDKDGHFRYNELTDANTGHLFDTSGSLDASLTAFVKIGVGLPTGGFLGYEKDFNIASVDWYSFSSSATANPFNPPGLKLASQQGSTLVLNTGPLAQARNYEVNNPDETFVVTHDQPQSGDPNSGEAIIVSAYGLQQRFPGITKITADLGDGNDVLTVGSNVTSTVSIRGGDGNKQVSDAGSGGLTVAITGNGNDVVRGGLGSNDLSVTGDGNNQLVGGQGDATTTNQLTVTGNGDNLLQGGVPLDKSLNGSTNVLTVIGNGINELVAGNGPDTLNGGAGVNTFIAGLGHDTIHIPPAANRQQQLSTPNQISWDVGDGNLDIFSGLNSDIFNNNALEIRGADPKDTLIQNQSFTIDPSGLDGGARVTVAASPQPVKTITVTGLMQTISVDGTGKAGHVQVDDLGPTSVQHVSVNLGEEANPDFLNHDIVVNGAAGLPNIDVQTLKAFVFQPRPVNDRFDAPSGGVMQVAFRASSNQPAKYDVDVADINGVDSVNLQAVGAHNTVNVHSTTGHIIIRGAQAVANGPPAGSDTYNISSDAPSNTGVFFDSGLTIDNSRFKGIFPALPATLPTNFGLVGPIDIHAGSGVNTLSASESGAGYSDHAVLTSNQITGTLPPNPFSPTYQINYDTTGSWGQVSLATGKAADTVDVRSTLPSVSYEVNSGGGGDTINVGDLNNTLDSLRGGLSLNGADGLATVNVNDQSSVPPQNASRQNYEVTASSVVRNATTGFSYSGMKTVNLNTSNHNSTTRVTSTASPTEVVVNGGTGINGVLVSDALGRLDQILGNVDIHGQGITLAAINDQGTTTPEVYGISKSLVFRFGKGLIFYDNLKNIAIAAGSGGNIVNVTSTPPKTQVILASGKGKDTIDVGDNANKLDGIQGPLVVEGQGGGDALSLNDQGSTAAHTYGVTANSVTRDGIGKLTYHGVASLSLSGGSGGDTVNVTGISAATPLTLTGGSGNDTFNLNNADLTDHPLANHVVTVKGQGGTDTLNIKDQASALDHVYSLSTDSLNRTNLPLTVNWDKTLENLHINGGSGNDRFKILQVAPSPAAAIALNGGGGTNTLDYSSYTGDVLVDLPLGVATGLSGGLSAIQNVTGSIGNDVIVGDSNPNVLTGGTLRNLIIGGGAADQIFGGGGDDILIGGSTDFDKNIAALADFMVEWLRNDLTFAQRVVDIETAGKAVPKQLPVSVLNGTGFKLDRSTVHNDQAANVLTGSNGNGNNWFLFNPKNDTLNNRKQGDIRTVVQ